MENNKEEQLNDKQLKEVSGGQEALNSWDDEPMKKLEEVSGGTDSDADEMMEGPLKVYHTIQDVIETIKNAFEN